MYFSWFGKFDSTTLADIQMRSMDETLFSQNPEENYPVVIQQVGWHVLDHEVEKDAQAGTDRP